MVACWFSQFKNDDNKKIQGSNKKKNSETDRWIIPVLLSLSFKCCSSKLQNLFCLWQRSPEGWWHKDREREESKKWWFKWKGERGWNFRMHIRIIVIMKRYKKKEWRKWVGISCLVHKFTLQRLHFLSTSLLFFVPVFQWLSFSFLLLLIHS